MSVPTTSPTFRVNDHVWKEGGASGYSGPGEVVAVFKNWMGANRYVVAHKVQDGVGWFYHIYSQKELSRQPPDVRPHDEDRAPRA
jgi:hypothetical protein